MVAVDEKGTLQTFYMRYLRVSNPCTYTTGPGIAGQIFAAVLTCPAVVLGNGRLEEVRVEATASSKKVRKIPNRATRPRRVEAIVGMCMCSSNFQATLVGV
jgi:hypothetical protein